MRKWTKLRTMLVPLTSALEPLQECFLLGFLTSLASNALFGWNSLLFLVGHVTLWMILDYILLKSVQSQNDKICNS
uniref:Uncharacterized protein n=1 Tax=Romanomermis culicivorax TaxID=13658 RepID=A0A915JPU7_ROMCU